MDRQGPHREFPQPVQVVGIFCGQFQQQDSFVQVEMHAQSAVHTPKARFPHPIGQVGQLACMVLVIRRQVSLFVRGIRAQVHGSGGPGNLQTRNRRKHPIQSVQNVAQGVVVGPGHLAPEAGARDFLHAGQGRKAIFDEAIPLQLHLVSRTWQFPPLQRRTQANHLERRLVRHTVGSDRVGRGLPHQHPGRELGPPDLQFLDHPTLALRKARKRQRGQQVRSAQMTPPVPALFDAELMITVGLVQIAEFLGIHHHDLGVQQEPAGCQAPVAPTDALACVLVRFVCDHYEVDVADAGHQIRACASA